MKLKLVNRFDDETIFLDNVRAYSIAPKFKEIRVTFSNGNFKKYSAVTYECIEEEV